MYVGSAHTRQPFLKEGLDPKNFYKSRQILGGWEEIGFDVFFISRHIPTSEGHSQGSWGRAREGEENFGV